MALSLSSNDCTEPSDITFLDGATPDVETLRLSEGKKKQKKKYCVNPWHSYPKKALPPSIPSSTACTQPIDTTLCSCRKKPTTHTFASGLAFTYRADKGRRVKKSGTGRCDCHCCYRALGLLTRVNSEGRARRQAWEDCADSATPACSCRHSMLEAHARSAGPFQHPSALLTQGKVNSASAMQPGWQLELLQPLWAAAPLTWNFHPVTLRCVFSRRRV